MSTQGRAPQQEPESWYAANMGNDSQGLIVDEKTGANIAIAYDRKHAPLLAAAPAMYEALQAMLDGILYARGASMPEDRWKALTTIARQAIAQAEGWQA